MSTWEKTLPTTGETNWGLKYNEAIGEIRNKVDNKIDTEHEFVINDITNLEAELNSKSNTDHDHTGYADVSHSHSDYASSIATINNTLQTINDSISILQNTINLLLPDLGSVTIEADIDNIGGGIRITCTTSPIILIRSWNIKVRSLGSLIYNSENSSNVVFISGELLSETESNTLLSITVTANSGQTTKAETFSFTYVKTPSLIDAKLASFQDIIDNELTIANILDSIANDANVCQAQANMLQHSNTLVTKIINDDDFVTKIAEEIIAKQNA